MDAKQSWSVACWRASLLSAVASHRNVFTCNQPFFVTTSLKPLVTHRCSASNPSFPASFDHMLSPSQARVAGRA